MNEIANINPQMVAPLSAIAIREQVNLIQSVMKEVMQKDQHYGIVPGCGKKPTLLKPGAEKLAMTFRLRPIMDNDRDIRITQMESGHREITVYCHIYNMGGLELATGIGSCSTMESKYRYRNVSDYEITGDPIPKDSKERKAEYRREGFGMKNIDGVWEWVKYKEGSKSENPDVADTYNTVLKMAKKRAFVDGILSATAASDIFTQDIEDLPEAEVVHTEPAKPAAEAPAAKPPQRKSETAGAVTKILKGLIADHKPPNGKGPHAFYIEGEWCKTFDEDTAECLIAHRTADEEVEATCVVETKGAYTNNMIKEVAVLNK